MPGQGVSPNPPCERGVYGACAGKAAEDSSTGGAADDDNAASVRAGRTSPCGGLGDTP